MKRIVLVSGLGTLVSLGVIFAGCGGGGGTTAGTTGSGGAAPTGTGGAATGTGGRSGSGTGGSGTGVNPMTLPLCTTQVRDAPCTVGDPTAPDCMVRCGPNVDPTLRGYRPLVCGPNTNSATGLGFSQLNCYFDPALNYACYKLPTPTMACPAGTTTATGMNACTAAPCTPCGDPVDITKGYTDGSNAPKAGFCVCNVNAATGASTWTCGSNKEYPCYSATPGAALPPGCT